MNWTIAGCLHFLSRLGVTAAVIGFSALSSGCQHGPQVRFSSAEEVLARVFERTSCSRSVVGDAAIEVAGPFAHYEGKLMYKAASVSRLRFDLYSDFGVSLAALASNEEHLAFYDLSSNRFVEGPPDACHLAQLTQVEVPPMALVELLRGRPPVLKHEPEQAKLSFRNPWFDDPHYEISLVGDHDSEQIIWLDVPKEDWTLALEEQRVYLSRVKVRQKGRLSYSVDLGDYRAASRASLEPSKEEREMGIVAHQASGPVCETELPYLLSFDMGRAGHRLNIRVTEAAHNPPIVPSAYELRAPRGARMSRASCD